MLYQIIVEVKIMFRKIIVCLLIGFTFATVAVAQVGNDGSVRGGHRDRAPVISVKDFKLDAMVGKVVLIGFWKVSDCAVCEAYIPWLTQMQVQYGEDGLIIVAVNEDNYQAIAMDQITKMHPRIQVVLDATGSMGARYQLEGMPSTYLYDRNLNMREKFVGFVPEETDSLETAIVKLLEQEYKE